MKRQSFGRITRNYAFPQNFETRKLGKITVFVNFVTFNCQTLDTFGNVFLQSTADPRTVPYLRFSYVSKYLTTGRR